MTNDLTFDGMELVTQRAEVAPTKLKKLTDTYQEHAKLVFMFDVSGSMGEKIIKDPNNPFGENNNVSKIDAMRTLAKQEIKARFDKYPRSRVAVIAFSTESAVLSDDDPPEALWPELEKMRFREDGRYCDITFGGHEEQAKDWRGNLIFDDNGKPTMTVVGGVKMTGGTDILLALRKAMDVCRDKPSMIGVHHFIVVSDGQDYAAEAKVEGWIPVFKASGVVLDYIHIGSDEPNYGLNNACEQTGGECVSVASEDDLRTKFVAAAQRLCLPAPE